MKDTKSHRPHLRALPPELELEIRFLLCSFEVDMP